MILEQLRVGGMGNFCYLGKSEETGEGFVVDPGCDVEVILRKSKEMGLNVTHILLTHHHYDHVDGAMLLKAKTGAKILGHTANDQLLKGTIVMDGFLEDGQKLSFGKNEIVEVVFTPGHTPGGICLIAVETWLITGDTLFIGNCGRTDLPGSSPRQLFESLQKIKKLADHLIVFSGHDYGPRPFRTLGEEKQQNPTLRASSFKEFEAIP